MSKDTRPPEDLKYIMAYMNHLIVSERFDEAGRYMTDFFSPSNENRLIDLTVRYTMLMQEKVTDDDMAFRLNSSTAIRDMPFLMGAGLFSKLGVIIAQKREIDAGNIYFKKAIKLLKRLFIKDSDNAQHEYAKAVLGLALGTDNRQKKCKYLTVVLKTKPTARSQKALDVARQEYSRSCQ